jgi:hypothetical protein
MGTEYIKDKNCKHKWIKRKATHPYTKKVIATWELCEKCDSERKRKVYN